MKIPWFPKETIAAVAAEVIADYQCIVRQKVTPPIPVEDIIERGLGLNLTFADLKKKLKLDDVLGAIYVTKQLICIDESLDKLSSKGRLYFTCAHEAGHWVLHRRLIGETYRSAAEKGFIFCRVRDAKRPIEWQADYFASCLLMPEGAVRLAFDRVFGRAPLRLHNVASAFCGPLCFDPSVATWPRIAADVIDVGGFTNVSKQAMIIRLQALGLVKNITRTAMNWDAACGIA